MSGITSLVNVFANVILNPLAALLFSFGLLVFVFGVVEFFFEFDVRGDSHAKENGKNHMLWGIVGMFVMLAAWAIVRLIANSLGASMPSY